MTEKEKPKVQQEGQMEYRSIQLASRKNPNPLDQNDDKKEN